MSAHRSTGKHESDKLQKGEKIDSRLPPSLRVPPSSAGGHHTHPQRIKHEQPLTSNDEDTQPDTPDTPRPKSSRDKDSTGQKPSSAAPNGRAKSSHDETPATDEKTSGVERHPKSVHTSDGEEGEMKSASPKRKNEKKTPSSATMGSGRFPTQGPGRRMVDSNPQPYVLQSDLRKGHNYYLYCLGKIYDVSDMRRRKEMQYWNLLARQRQLGFHSPKECEVYMRYLSRPRTAEYSTAYSGQYRTKSTEGRRRREETDRRTRTVSAADGRGRTVDKEDRDQKEWGGDIKGRAVSSKTAPASSKATPVSSKTAPVSSKRRPVTSEPRSISSKTRPVSSKPRAVSSKEPRLDSSKEVRRVSREEAGDEELSRQRNNETTDEENEVSQNDEKQTKNRRNSQSGKDQRRTGDEQKPSVALLPKAAETGNESEDESSDSDESQRRSNIRRSDGGDNRPVDATNSDGRNTEETSSDDDAW